MPVDNLTKALGVAGAAVLAVTGLFFGPSLWRLYNVHHFKRTKRVLISGAAGQVGYALTPLIARGAMLGHDQPVILHLLDIPAAASSLEGLRMELLDLALPLLEDVVVTTNVDEACRNVDVAIMLGGYPRRPGDEKRDMIAKSIPIYSRQGAALSENANQDVKVVVVANPANTNAFILREHAPAIPPTNITSLTRLDHNRALAQVAQRAGCSVSSVKNVVIWGNHTATHFPDVCHGSIEGRPIREAVDDDEYWEGEFVAAVQLRGAAIIRARGLSSATSAASAVCDHIRSWILGTPEGEWVSMGVVSDGSYGITPGLMFSFPVTCSEGKWEIVSDLDIDEVSEERIEGCHLELREERDIALECLAEAARGLL